MKRFTVIALVVVLFFLGAAIVGFRLAVGMLKGRVAAALGPGSGIAEIKVGWSSIELVGLNIAGPKGWPAEQTLRAERVDIVPSLRTLMSDEIQISSITVEKPYVSMLRVPGKLVMLPSLLENRRREKEKKGDEERSGRSVAISEITLRDGVIEIFDATVSRPPLKTRLEQIEGVVRDIVAPSLKEKTGFDIAAVVKGVRGDGNVKVSGWVALAGRDSSSHIVLDRVDLVGLQPYLVKRGESRVERGALSLNLNSEVRNNQLDGKGKMIIRQLAFAPGRGTLDTFMGLPRNAVIGFLKDHNDAIDVNFVLKGDISHPDFSLNETLATRIATAMAGQLGVGIKEMAQGLETVGRKGVEGAAGVTEAIGAAVRGLFGGGEKK